MRCPCCGRLTCRCSDAELKRFKAEHREDVNRRPAQTVDEELGRRAERTEPERPRRWHHPREDEDE